MLERATCLARCAGAVLLAAMLLSGCGRSETDASRPVRYSGSTLIVRNVQYAREPSDGLSFAKGHLLVQPREGRDRCVGDLLQTFGLSSSAAAGMRNIRDVVVPAGFELQWATALSRQECVASVGTDDPSRNAH